MYLYYKYYSSRIKSYPLFNAQKWNKTRSISLPLRHAWPLVQTTMPFVQDILKFALQFCASIYVVINRQQLYALLWSVYPKTARDPGTYFGRRFFEAGKTDLLSHFGDRQHVHASKDKKVNVCLRIKPTKDAAQMLAKFLTNFLWEKF